MFVTHTHTHTLTAGRRRATSHAPPPLHSGSERKATPLLPSRPGGQNNATPSRATKRVPAQGVGKRFFRPSPSPPPPPAVHQYRPTICMQAAPLSSAGSDGRVHFRLAPPEMISCQLIAGRMINDYLNMMMWAARGAACFSAARKQFVAVILDASGRAGRSYRALLCII